MIPAICVVGKSNEGKTTLLEGLIPELKRRGYRIAVVKHTDKEVELDTPGKDSWRLSRAGSDAVVLSTPGKVVIFRAEVESSISEIQRFTGLDFDLFIIEGYKQARLPKIEVRRGHRSGSSEILSDLIAIVSDQPLSESVPVFTFGDTKGLVDLIEKRFFAGGGSEVNLYVNRKNISLNPFVRKLIASTVAGMVSVLKVVKDKINEVTIWVKLVK
ncbi:MAG: molybdopterin-guanine dinucleotide biosynthesis protein B [Dehalococcoidia bacterium]|nr:molybdopterin-guanine dinucleotide biosynthesis protein B [Dehalococcoidia bacterium]